MTNETRTSDTTRIGEDSDYVDRGVPLARLVAALGGIAALVGMGLGVAAVVERAFTPASPGRQIAGTLETLHEEPRVESDQPAERRQLEQSQRQRLSSYGWVAREAGFVYVPIDVAMDEFVRQHQSPQAPAVEPAEANR